MIGSFWNLCRACPSMPVDKLHSEYRSTYKWHEYTGNRQEVVRRPPQANVSSTGENEKEKLQNMHLKEEDGTNTGCKMEPAMPRRKKHPELAYRTHEFLAYDEDGSHDNVDVSIRPDRARGPAEEGGLLRKAISRISTEYRLQFAWPPGHHSRADTYQQKDGSLPRKSLSMGAIKPSAQAMIHKKHNELDTKDVSELEPLVNESANINEKNIRNEKFHPKQFHSEYTKKFRPFSQYDHPEIENRNQDKDENKNEQDKLIEIRENGPTLLSNKNVSGWFKEVVELRKKAGQYKHRGWGTELASEHISELYNKQIELWEQVSRRSSLSALSLASTTRKPYTKEEKEEENNKKSSPSKGVSNQSNVSHRKGRDSIDNSSRAVREIIRHHLERTTGGSEYDGLILSPTREKLEPTIPKRIEDRDHQKENQSRSSPKKDSPQKTKRGSSKSNGTKPPLRTIRSQSVGPTEVSEKSSPKRLSRSTTVRQQKTPRDSTSSPPSSTIRRPRPSDPSQEKCTISMEEDVVNGEREDIAHVVKSPPEPTRVKSPEQIMMRSPDPVNWTVPLDTGKTFTVTQNVRDGELMNRPHSEVKAWTPPDVPPPAALSAPPELTEQAKAQAWRSAQAQANTEAEPSTGPSTATSVESVAVRSVTIADDRASPPPPASTSPPPPDARAVTAPSPAPQSASAAVDTPTPHSTAEPSKQDPPGIDVGGRSLATDVLEKARSRFDEFWGKKDPRED